MFTESKIEKVYGMIQAKRALTVKIERALSAKRKRHVSGNGDGATKAKAVSAQRKLHGKYLGAIRPLTKTLRKQVSKIREEHGYVKAIAKAKAFAREA